MNDIGGYFRGEAARPRPYAGQLTPAFQQALARDYAGRAESECHFTHRLQWPDGRVINGALDLGGEEETYIGRVPLWGKRVLEYLPGSGGLSAFLAVRADELVVLDQAPGVPLGAADGLALRTRYGWWLTKAALGFEAQAVYADLYSPPEDLGRFDMVILTGLFSKLQHPFLALQYAARLADTLVVVEPAFPEAARAGETSPAIARFMPGDGDTPARWQHTPAAIMLMLANTGLADQTVNIHTPRSNMAPAVPHLTIVAKRSASRDLQVVTMTPAPPAATPPAAPPAPPAPAPLPASPPAPVAYADASADDLPLPSSAGRFSVAGTDDVEAFVELGRAGQAALQASLARAGTSAASLGQILDFGCGVGRVLRYWYGQPGLEIHGTDLNAESISWCAQNLTFARFKTNGLAPQLDYADGYFGFVYALSVFTHLPKDIQLPWLRELIRIIRPGGLLYFTTHGDSYRKVLTPEMLASYDRDEFISGGDDQPGSNHCGTFHPPAYVRNNLLTPLGLTLVEFLPEGAVGNPTQDSWLVRKP